MKSIEIEVNKTSDLTGLEIAVIGMAGRFPGAKNIKQFWENLKNGVESISIFSDDQMEKSGIDPGLYRDPRYVKAKGVLDDVEYFDASFFEYTPNEAKMMDPQMRLFHECTWEALENAGYEPGDFKGKIGLYGGASDNFYWQALVFLSGAGDILSDHSLYHLISKEFLTTRVSFKLNLRGPSFLVQTACSTSLVAIHLACQGLLNGECTMALAGGVSVTVPQESGYIYQEGMVRSPDGHCRAFDAGAKGFVGGNGVGVVVLKPLEDAQRDGDFIHALIKGSAVNNDGNQKAGFTAPSVKAQVSVIKAALGLAEINPETIDYVEAHGTGTALGDPIEIEALKRAFNTQKKGYCKIGSVKTNVGHLDAAAGAAGFIKTVLVLKHRQIPPSLHFNTPNPKIDFENSPFTVSTRLTPWENDKHPFRAGVTSLGIGGTNAHVVLEEWISQNGRKNAPPSLTTHRLILLSAGTPTALDRMTKNLTLYLQEHPTINLADTSYTLQVGRKALKHRGMVICSTVKEAVSALSGIPNITTHHIVEDKNRVVFMFAGLGGQYVNMGLDLYKSEPVFREEMDRCFEILNGLSDYDIKKILYPGDLVSKVSEVGGENSSVNSVASVAKNKNQPAAGSPQSAAGPEKINRIDISQLVIFILEYALASLLIRWRIKPDAMIGYSFGEYTAACLSGVFSLEDALKIILCRGKLLAGVPGGAMLSVPLSRAELVPLLNSKLSIAIDNGTTCIAAGTKEAIYSFAEEMKKRKLLCMLVPHSTALHSHMMDAVLEKFEKELAKIQLNSPRIPYISNLTGTWIDARQVVRPGYWSKHLRETVRFAAGIRELAQTTGTIFIEIGPGRDLSTMVKRFIEDKKNQKVIHLIRQQRKNVTDSYYLLVKLGYLWLYGVNIDWSAFYLNEKRGRLPLPAYPFERKRFWLKGNLYQLLKEKDRHYELINISPDETAETADLLIEDEFNGDLVERSQLNAPYEPPANDIQRTIARVWEKYFGITGVGIHDDFFEMGGDSLKAMNVSAMIQKELNIEIPVAEFFERQTVERLADYVITSGGKIDYFSVKSIEKKEYYPVSSAQRRQYVLQQFGEKNTAYNDPIMVNLEGDISKDKIEDIFKKLLKRHESLRTSFEIVGGQPVQKVHEKKSIDLSFEFYEVGGTAVNSGTFSQLQDDFVKEIPAKFIRPFDLDKAPLFRVGLVWLGEDRFLLMLDIHHIVTDGTSHHILINDFISIYKGEELPVIPIRYKDYSHWQNNLFRSGKLNEQEEYWLKEFEYQVPVLDLPADYSRPPLLSFEGSRVFSLIDSKETAVLKKLASSQNATLFMILLGVYNILLSKLSGQEDIICGTVISGRNRAEFQQIIGMFINTLAIRNYPRAEETFEEFLKDIKKKTFEAFENQDYQFENLVDKVVKNRDTDRNPLFDVMFILQNLDFPGVEMTGLKLTRHIHKTSTAKFDLQLDCREQSDSIGLNFEYSTRLFKEETIRRFTGYFKRIVSAVVEDITVKIADIDIISGEEREQILYQFNDTQIGYPEDKTFYQLFEEQAAGFPDRIALVCAGNSGREKIQLTYKGLNERSNQLADLLKQKGVEADAIVGIMVERSIEMIIGLLGILKVGGAYMPIDPDYPEERKKYILKDSGVKILLTSHEIAILSSPEAFNNCPKGVSNHLHPSPLPVNSLAYVIYTSGSTGKPKGVMVDQGSVTNLLVHLQRTYPLEETDVYLLKTSFVFDVSVAELFGWFPGGGRLVILNPGEEKDPGAILDTIERCQVTHINFVPSMFRIFLEILNHQNIKKLSYLRYIFLAGEALSPGLVKKAGSLNINSGLENLYGPTEATVYAAGFSLSQWNQGEPVPIGKPLANSRLYILNRNHQILPIGVPGQLCIGGNGLARGYLNKPGLTAERFIHPSPFTLHSSSIYRTGDLARWLWDGNIEFIGRLDHQVKIRGFRIELEEIESKLSSYNGIDETVVVAKENEYGEKYLCAYITSSKEIAASELRTHLLRSLPSYMVPANFVQVDKIPLTSNGKVDRKAVATLGKKLEMGIEYVAPQSNKEIIISFIWKEVLNVEEVGIHDNFFDLGGTSMDAVRVNNQLKEIFEMDIPIVAMYQYTTIASFTHFFDLGDEKMTGNFRRIERFDKIEKGKANKQKRRKIRDRRKK